MKRSSVGLLVLTLASLGLGCGGGGETPVEQAEQREGVEEVAPEQTSQAPVSPESIEGLRVGESADLANGTTTVTVDAAYKVTPPESELESSENPNWMFFEDVREGGGTGLLIAATVSVKEGTNAAPQFDPASFLFEDEDGYTLPHVWGSPPPLDQEHPAIGWEGRMEQGQTRGATIAHQVPPGQGEGIEVTYQYSVEPGAPRATWEVGDIEALPEAPGL
jgi:hypothetical protein